MTFSGFRIACGFSALLGLVGPVGCSEPTSDLRSAVELLSAERGEVAERAHARIAPHGRDALPYLEAALHRASPAGRRNIVTALRRLALPESAALLGHIAAFDAETTVRAEAYFTLATWAARRLPEAQVALLQADQARSGP